MTKEQLDGKFIICRTKDEADFILYWIGQLFNRYDVYNTEGFRNPICIRTKRYDTGHFGWNDPGDYENDPASWGHIKEEECSVLFGNLVKRWLKNGRT